MLYSLFANSGLRAMYSHLGSGGLRMSLVEPPGAIYKHQAPCSMGMACGNTHGTHMQTLRAQPMLQGDRTALLPAAPRPPRAEPPRHATLSSYVERSVRRSLVRRTAVSGRSSTPSRRGEGDLGLHLARVEGARGVGFGLIGLTPGGKRGGSRAALSGAPRVFCYAPPLACAAAP